MAPSSLTSQVSRLESLPVDSFVMALTWGEEKMIGSSASGGWENYPMAGEHISIANLFLNNFLKTEYFLRNF
jgi:hypothetical protein